MRKERLYWSIVSAMFAVGGGGILFFVISLFHTDSPTVESDKVHVRRSSVVHSNAGITKSPVDSQDAASSMTDDSTPALEKVTRPHEPQTATPQTPDEPKKQEIRAEIAKLETQLTEHQKEYERLKVTWEETRDLLLERSDYWFVESPKTIYRLQAPLNEEGISDEKREQIMAAVRQHEQDVNRELHDLAEATNQLSTQRGQVSTQMREVREEIAFLKAMIGEE